MAYNYVKRLKMTPMDQNEWFWENSEKNLKKNPDFWGGDGPSNRFFERFQTFPNFLRNASDRPSLGLQFAPYEGLGVAWAQKILRNYEKNTTKT